MTGAYVHIPFCVVRCNYCDFNAYAGLDHLANRYVGALRAEIRARADGRAVSTIFFGGGTPTQLTPEALRLILDELRTGLDVAPDAEVTVEANPESVDEDVFSRLQDAGFNRVSIGVQSLAPQILKSLGRVHDAGRALTALRQAVSTGFQHVNADLIFGTPGETLQDFTSSLEAVVSTGVDHVSAYALTIEEGTPLSTMVDRGLAPPPDEDDQADKYQVCHELLKDAGFERYEVSNWAKAGAECRHNLGYWRSEDYFGFGAGAHSHFGGRRSWNVKSVQGYIDRTPYPEEGHEVVDDRASEAAVLGMRLAGGLDIGEFAERWGVDPFERWGAEVRALESAGLVEVYEGRWSVPEDRVFSSGEVYRALLASNRP